ncbi:MAG: hypothetical protein FLDDKLPJ_02824 [Phycisphaerae bacterium]|nr:hypothetical protein [Phycisphaerae bacterium]
MARVRRQYRALLVGDGRARAAAVDRGGGAGVGLGRRDGGGLGHGLVTRDDHTVILEHGKPLIFGKNRDKGIRLNGTTPEIVPLGGDIKEDDLLFHDERAPEPTLAYLLSRMHHPEFPEPLGVFRAVQRPTYEALANQQIATARSQHGEGSLETLFDDGETWVVN